MVGLDRGAGRHEAARALDEAARNVMTGPGAFRLAAVSAADPVDRSSGRLVQLPDAPLLVGDLDPVSVLSPTVAGPVLVDNDVNWAARAERNAGEGSVDNFVYLHLGEGLGCAVVADGDVTRGHAGLAGEIAHVVTIGPQGLAMPLTEVFAQLGLRRPGTAAIDVDRLRARFDERQSGGLDTLQTVARALSGVIAADDRARGPRAGRPGRVVGPRSARHRCSEGLPGRGSAHRPAAYGDPRRPPRPPRRPDARTRGAARHDRHAPLEAASADAVLAAICTRHDRARARLGRQHLAKTATGATVPDRDAVPRGGV